MQNTVYRFFLKSFFYSAHRLQTVISNIEKVLRGDNRRWRREMSKVEPVPRELMRGIGQIFLLCQGTTDALHCWCQLHCISASITQSPSETGAVVGDSWVSVPSVSEDDDGDVVGLLLTRHICTFDCLLFT